MICEGQDFLHGQEVIGDPAPFAEVTRRLIGPTFGLVSSGPAASMGYTKRNLHVNHFEPQGHGL